VRPFKEFDIPDFASIQSHLVPCILRRYTACVNFWNHVDLDMLAKDVPQVIDAIVGILGQVPSRAYLLAVPDAPEDVLAKKLGNNSLHRDTSIETCRLNWPILNSASIETRLYNSTAEPKQHVLPTGETYLTYRENDCREIARLYMTKPTLLHVHTIHGLFRASGPLPRYILSFNFANDNEILKNLTD
jgi:hypothetical protein